MTIDFFCQRKPDFPFHYKKLAKNIVCTVIGFLDFPYEAAVELTLTGDDEIRQINAETRGIDRATDVLSFPMLEFSSPGIPIGDPSVFADPETGEILLGDIVLSLDHIYAQAHEYGHSVKREYAFLIVHSMLHLLGYDHIAEIDRLLMEEKQKDIMKELGIKRS